MKLFGGIIQRERLTICDNGEGADVFISSLGVGPFQLYKAQLGEVPRLTILMSSQRSACADVLPWMRVRSFQLGEDPRCISARGGPFLMHSNVYSDFCLR